MATLPLGLQPYAQQDYRDPATGEVVSLGSLAFFEVGTTTPAAVYADADGNTSLGTTVNLSVTGFAPQVFFANHGYRIRLFDDLAGAGTQLAQWDQVEDPGTVFAATSGAIQGEGEKAAGDTYTTDANDNLVVVPTSGAPFNITIGETAAERGLPLIVLNSGDQVLTVNPQAGDTINGDTSIDIPASTGDPNWPGITLYPVAPSSWYAVSAPAFS